MARATTRLRQMLTDGAAHFFMEAHNGLSARIAAEAGFDGLWASSLTMSAADAVRDNNELSWTQVVERVEFMVDAADGCPVLVDGDTGHGNFNNFRRFVAKLEQRGAAGVCIEDKRFPKTNSFLDEDRQELADIEEFTGKLKAGKDAQSDPDFCIVARVEAFIAGYGLHEALRRAEAYRQAGADAILIHSKLSTPAEILSFTQEWGGRCPVVIVPTKYYRTPTDVFREAGVNLIIWANHLLRASLVAMQRLAGELQREQSLAVIEDKVAGLGEVFRLQGASELQAAERRYLPEVRSVGALFLAASQGQELGALTADRPKAMLPVGGQPLLERSVALVKDLGLRPVTVVRGFAKDQIQLPGVETIDNERYAETREVYSLQLGLAQARSSLLVAYGDVLMRRHLVQLLLEPSEAELVLVVDAQWKRSRNLDRYGDFVSCAEPYDRLRFDAPTSLVCAGPDLEHDRIHGEWTGLLRLSETGVKSVREVLAATATERLRMAELFNRLVETGHSVEVRYCEGGWLDLDELPDVVDLGEFL